jgi:AcrR family transcriptional regulator
MNNKKYTGASARTYTLLLNQAIEISQQGHLPSLNELAVATSTSRATVYRYFPSHADLVHTVMIHSLSNLMSWQPLAVTPQQRVQEALNLLFEDFKQHETLFRSVLQLSLLPSADSVAPTEGSKLHRGLRIDILQRALQPLREQMDDQAFNNLLISLSVLFGIEALVVLKDIWSMDMDSARDALSNSAQALINQALTTTRAPA